MDKFAQIVAGALLSVAALFGFHGQEEFAGGLITKPNTFTPNTIIRSSEVNANFDTIYNEVNGNLNNANIAASAAIEATKIQGTAIVSNASSSQSITSILGVTGTTTINGGLYVSSTTNYLLLSRMTTTQRNAITSPQNGAMLYNLTAGQFEVYEGGAWVGISPVGVTATSSFSGKGVIEQATGVEAASTTPVGGGSTDAPLALSTSISTSSRQVAGHFVPVTRIDGSLENTFGGNANGLAQLNTSTLVVQNPASASTTPTASGIPIANASTTIDAGWVPASGNSFLTTGEAINGSATPQLVSVSTTGLLFAADSDDIGRRKVYGFITTNAAVTTTPLVITDGLVGGFTGLTIGAQYYASSTAGAITNVPVASTTIPIGYAVSASQLRVDFGTKQAQIVPPLISGSNGTSQTFNIGFRPEVIEMTVAMTVGASTGNQAKVYARFLGTTLVNSTRVTNDPTTQYDEFSTNNLVEVTAGAMIITISSITDTGFTITYTGSSMTTQNMSVLVSGN